MGEVLTVITMLKVRQSPNGERHGERPFWREMGTQYLNAWLIGIQRDVPAPKRIVVMTDDPAYVINGIEPGLASGVETVPLDARVNAPGFWAKLNMFRAGVSEGRCLYCDLDNITINDLAALCALPADPLVMLDDRRVPRLPNGSVVLFEAERCREIWEGYARNPRLVERGHVVIGDDFSRAYDQAFIADWFRLARPFTAVPFFQDLLPAGYILNAVSELPHADDWRQAHLIFGSGGGKEGKPHTAGHQVFRENWAGV